MPALHHSNFFTGQMLFLVPKQQRKSNDGKVTPAETAKQK